MRRLLTLARDSRLPLAATILSGLLTGFLTIGQARGLSRIVNGVFLGGQSLADVAGILRILILVIFARALLAWGSEISANAVAVRVKNDLRQRLFDKIVSLGPAYTRRKRTGELVNAAVEGVEALDAYFSQYLPQLVITALVPLSILLFVLPRDLLSAVVLFVTAPLIPVFMYLIGKGAEIVTKRQYDTLSRLSAHFLDSLQGLTTLKELGRSKAHADSIAESSDRFRDVTLKVLRVTFLSALVLELVATVSTALVAVEVGLRLLYGHLAFEQAFFVLLLAPEFYIPLRMLGLRFHAGMSGTTAAKRIFEILDIPNSGDQGAGNQETGIWDQESLSPNPMSPPNPLSPNYLITFENLSYTYPGENQPALENINLEVQAGEHIALVGSSGAGKSTLASLLLRFIEPTGGTITINHKPLTDISLASWRSLVAWVPQNPYLFHETLAANLRLARPDATDADLESAVRLSHLNEFVASLPQGYATVVGEGGARLSGGQAQRLALARAFLKDAPLLVLDEPTSSLDPEQETLVEASVRELMKGRTVITIAHRLNTVFQSDRIVVLEGGRIIESGTHRDLLALGGMYARLVGASGQIAELAEPEQKPKDIFAEVSTPDHQPLTINHSPSTIPHSSPSILRLLAFLRGAWGWVALSVLLGVLTVGSNVGLMATSSYLISAAALHPDVSTLQIAIVGVRFFGIGRGVFRYAERLVSHDVTFRLLARLRTWFYRALEPLAPARLMQYRAGDLLNRIIADVQTLENFYVRVVAPPLVAVLIAAGMTFFFSCFDVTLAWVYLGFMLVLGIGVPLLSSALSRRTGADLVTRRADLQTRLVDGIQGLADLLAFGRGRDYRARLTEDGAAYGRVQRKLAALTGVHTGLTVLLVNLGMLTVLALSIPLVESGALDGVLLAVLALAALSGFEAVMPLPLAAQTMSASEESARRLFEVVDAEPAVKENREQRIESSELFSALSVSALSFTYPGNTQPALTNINFTLAPGQRIAIVGPSGAGKSTLGNLLLRFWEYSQGEIRLDGRDLHEVPADAVRQMVSVISQRTYFFNDTLGQNLLLARPTADESEVREAAQQAQIHEFIAGLPKGYETVIGERGLRLSGGERQRLAIARALLKESPILLLDEPTANLDPVTERLVLETLFGLARDRSLLLITHRLVGLEAMDEILVLDRGRIVERGSHADLLTRGGFYRRMWDLQNRMMVETGVA